MPKRGKVLSIIVAIIEVGLIPTGIGISTIINNELDEESRYSFRYKGRYNSSWRYSFCKWTVSDNLEKEKSILI